MGNTQHRIKLIKASEYEPPMVKPRRPYLWSDLWRDLYDAYLQSSEWQSKRQIVLARCNGLCSCGQPVSDIHHLSYENVFFEERSDFADLVGLCRPCHRREHAVELEQQ